MEEQIAALLARLDCIAASLARRRHALALIGVGSVGADLSRLDIYSDLDFFVIVENGSRDAFIDDIVWLSDIAPIAYSFRNSRHGHKVLFEDGIYAEFAVFNVEELPTVPREGGRTVWQREEADLSAMGTQLPAASECPTVEWRLGEILTNLYVGLTRLSRGERLSAQRFIQSYAVDHVLKLLSLVEPPSPAAKDHFDSSRRVEQRFPTLAHHLPTFIQGYDGSVESALAMLQFLEGRFPVNRAIAQRIRELADAMAL